MISRSYLLLMWGFALAIGGGSRAATGEANTNGPTPQEVKASTATGTPTPLMDPMGPTKRNGLDETFFDDKKGDDAAGNSGQKISGRYRGDEPDYTTDQREMWMKNCEALKNGDQKAYRACFENEKRKSKETLRQQFDAVEKKQVDKNVPQPAPLLDEGRDPASED